MQSDFVDEKISRFNRKYKFQHMYTHLIISGMILFSAGQLILREALINEHSERRQSEDWVRLKKKRK